MNVVYENFRFDALVHTVMCMSSCQDSFGKGAELSHRNQRFSGCRIMNDESIGEFAANILEKVMFMN